MRSVGLLPFTNGENMNEPSLNLDRCPFCGGEAMLHHGKSSMLSTPIIPIWIACLECHASSQKLQIMIEESPSDKQFSTLRDLWNKRV